MHLIGQAEQVLPRAAGGSYGAHHLGLPDLLKLVRSLHHIRIHLQQECCSRISEVFRPACWSACRSACWTEGWD